MGEDFRKEHMVDKVEGWRGGGVGGGIGKLFSVCQTVV